MQRKRPVPRQQDVQATVADSAGAGAVHRAELDFEEWVTARGQALLRFAYLVTGDARAAEDAVQEALTSACARWDTISRARDPEAYVRRMVANAHVSWWRRVVRREVPVAQVHDRPVVGADGDEVHAVWALCATLPRGQRAAVVLRFYEGLSYAEVADVLGIAEPTARSQVHRALASLRTRLEEQDR